MAVNKPAEASNEMANFSIQDTISMGTGSQELLADLMEDTPDPGDVTPITTETTTQATTTETTTEVTTEAPKPNTSITDFLNEDEEITTTDTTTDTTTEVTAADTTTDATTEAPEGGEGEPTQFGALAQDLTNLGVFSEVEGEEPITTPEQFLEKFNSEKQKGAIEVVDNFIGQFGEKHQKAFDAIYVKGADPEEYFRTSSNIDKFAGLDLDQEANQIRVVKEVLKEQGYESEDIDAEVERLNNYGDLKSVSERHHKVLVKKEEAKLAQIESDAQEKLQEKTAIKNQYVNNVQTVLQDKLKTKEFDGIPLNPKLANELHDFLLVDKYKTSSGETLTEFDRTILDLKKPENHATKVKIGLLLKVLEKDPTLSTIQKKGVTNKTNALFSEVTRSAKKPVATKKGAAPKRWFQ